MIKLCVFDMDGLLLDSERYLYLYNEIEITKSLGYDIDEEFFRSLMGGSWNTYPEKVLEKAGKDFPIDKYMSILWDKINYTVDNEAIPLRKGAIEILDFCKQNNIKMSIATSTPYGTAIKCLKNSNVYDYFDFIITGDQVSKGKPDPEIFLKAIEHFNIDKKQALVFEDGHNGCLAARRGNCRLVIVKDLAYIDKEDEEYADLNIKDLNQAIEFIRRENETTSSI